MALHKQSINNWSHTLVHCNCRAGVSCTGTLDNKERMGEVVNIAENS